MAILSTSKKHFKLLPLTLFTSSPLFWFSSIDQGALTKGVCLLASAYLWNNQNSVINAPPKLRHPVLIFLEQIKLWKFISIRGGKRKISNDEFSNQCDCQSLKSPQSIIPKIYILKKKSILKTSFDFFLPISFCIEICNLYISPTGGQMSTCL